MSKSLFWKILLASVLTTSLVVDVTETSFESFINSANRVVLLVYSSDAEKNDGALEIIDNISIKLTENGGFWENVAWGRLDVNDNKQAKEDLQLKDTPSLLVFEEGEWVAYPDELFQESIELFLEKIYSDEPGPRIIDNDDELSKVEAEHELALLYGVIDEKDVPEAIASTRLLAKKFGLPIFLTYNSQTPKQNYSLVLKRDFHEGTLDYIGSRPFAPSFIRDLVESNAQKRCPIFTSDTYKKFFQTRQPMILFFDSKPDTPFINAAEKSLRRMPIDLLCRVVEFETEPWHMFGNMLAVSRYALPVVAIASQSNKDVIKYVLTKPDIEEVQHFFYEYSMGTLEPFYKSESIPKWQDPNVLKVVRTTFKESVIENEKSVFLCLYSKFCRNCDVMFQTMKDLSKVLTTKYPEVVFAIADMVSNDIDGINFVDLPGFFLYKTGEKTKPIKFEEQLTTENVEQFFDAHFPRPTPEDEKPNVEL